VTGAGLSTSNWRRNTACAIGSCFTVLATPATLHAQTGQGLNLHSRENRSGPRHPTCAGVSTKDCAHRQHYSSPLCGWIGRQAGIENAECRLRLPFSTAAEEVGGPTHEPASLPGGHIFVPGELDPNGRRCGRVRRGMPAHAMSHIAKRYGTRRMTRDAVQANHVDVPLVWIGGWSLGVDNDRFDSNRVSFNSARL
jgi:hypothetical protein